jgi:AsmA protein
MNKALRNSLIAAGLVIALILVLPFVVPLDMYRGRIETAAGSATGRVFKIDGPLRLTFFPRFGLRAKEVTLANTPGGRAAVMVAVGDIDLSVKLLPLFSGRIALDKITLDQPTIALEVDKDGNPNWKFGKATTAKTGETKKGGTLTLPASTEFSGIDITDGRVTYDNAKTGTHRSVDHVNVAVAITTADQPITATGDMTLADKKLTFAAHLATLKTFLGSGTTKFDLTADAELVHAAVKGQMLPDGTTAGDIKLASPSFHDLAAWLGTPLPTGGLNALTLSGQIENKDKITHFENLKITLDGQTIKGTLSIDARAKVPGLDGVLNVDHLDIVPYLSGGKKEGPKEPKEAGWSKKPISLALLKEFNATLTLTTGALRTPSLHLGRTVLRLVNANGLLTVFLDQVNLYGGSGSAFLVVNTRGPLPQIDNTMDFKGVQINPLLHDALRIDSIEGVGALKLEIHMAGASQNAIMHSLSGKGSITGVNGRFKGVDLGAVAKSVKTMLGGDATGTVASTSFNDMGASFVLANGVLATNDFHLKGNVVQMTGKGTIDIGGRGIDFRIHPEADYNGYGIGVPFHITGSWDRLHYAADVAAIVGGVMDSIKNGGAALGGLLGGKNGDKPAPGAKKKSVGDQLKNMFGIH